MNFACNKLLYRIVTLHHFLIRLLAKKRNDDFSFHQHYIPMNE